jgi:ferrous iron transport protein A
MPLTMMQIGETQKIIQITGKETVKKFLISLGFVEGGDITVVSEIGGNVIVNIKDTRIAIGKGMARKIMVG